MLIQSLLLCLALADPNTVGYMYDWHETSIVPTPEVQSELSAQQWQDGYIPKWYRLQYPGVDPNMFFRWERELLPTAVEWLQNPSDLNDDGKCNVRDYGIVADFHPGGLKSKPKPPVPPPIISRLEVLAMFAEMLFMTETER